VRKLRAVGQDFGRKGRKRGRWQFLQVQYYRQGFSYVLVRLLARSPFTQQVTNESVICVFTYRVDAKRRKRDGVYRRSDKRSRAAGRPAARGNPARASDAARPIRRAQALRLRR
jgi:hypothetical protein